LHIGCHLFQLFGQRISAPFDRASKFPQKSFKRLTESWPGTQQTDWRILFLWHWTRRVLVFDVNNFSSVVSEENKTKIRCRKTLQHYCLARINRAWWLAIASSFEAFETQVVTDNSPDRRSWKIQVSWDFDRLKDGFCLCLFWLLISSSTAEMLSSVRDNYGRPLSPVRSI